MSLKKPILLSFFIISFVSILQAQFMGIFLPEGKKEVSFPFENWSNFIVVNIKLNNTLPLRLIFDSGARTTLLFHREYTDIIGTKYDKIFDVYGADRSFKITALLARNVKFQLPQDIQAERQSILVLQDDYYELEKLIGTNIDGLLGIDFFKRFVVKLDYSRNIITFTEKSHFKTPHGYEKIPLLIENGQIFLDLPVEVTPKQIVHSKLLLDTGAATTLILNTNRKDSLLLPKNVTKGNIARGLGGYITGYTGRVTKLSIAPFEFNNLITSFQQLEDSIAYDALKDMDWREGIFGAELLSRFHTIIDFTDQVLYLKKNKFFKTKFNEDKSGLSIIATGINLQDFYIDNVLPNSPAERAELKVGDKIRKINGVPSNFFTIQRLMKKLQGKTGKQISLLVERNQTAVKKTITLMPIY